MIETGRIVEVTWAEGLVARELAVDGGENKLLARRMSLTEDTIKSHMKALLRKTKCCNRTELAIRLIRQEIVLTVPYSQRDRSSYEAVIIRRECV